MFQDIVNKELYFDNTKIDVSENCKNIIYALLKKDSAKRIGAVNEKDIKNHPWFADLDWDKLIKKRVSL